MGVIHEPRGRHRWVDYWSAWPLVMIQSLLVGLVAIFECVVRLPEGQAVLGLPESLLHLELVQLHSITCVYQGPLHPNMLVLKVWVG